MCLTKVYYNTYADGAQDISEKTSPCRDGRGCSRPDVRRYDRKFPFTKLGDSLPESHRSLSERQPTPYFGDSRGSKSPSPSRRRDSGYMTGDYLDAYGAGYDTYGYRSSRHDPRDRDRHDRGRDREPRFKRSSTTPQIVYMDRDRDRERDRDSKSSRSRSNSNSRDYSRDIPLGLVPLADEYGRRHHHHRRHSTSSSSRSRSRDDDPYYASSSTHHRRRTDDPAAYTPIPDADDRRRQRRERRMSSPSYTDAGAADGYTADPRYLPRRASTVIHQDPSGTSSSSSSGRKQLRWSDQIRSKRERQNAEIASRQPWSASSSSWNSGEPVKGILKHHKGGESGKGKGREAEEIEDLRRALERMEVPRGRGREGREVTGWGWEGEGGGRRKRRGEYVY